MKQLLFARKDIARVGTRFTWPFAHDGASDSTEARWIVPWSAAGTFRYLHVRVGAALGGGRSISLTLRVNGADTALTVTIPDGTTSAADVTHEVTINAGDRVSIKYISSASVAGSDDLSFSLEFESSTAAVSVYGGCNANQTSNSASTRYNRALAYLQASWGTTAPPQDLVGVASNLTRYDIVLTASPGAGKSYTFALVLNDVVQDGTGGTTNTTLAISDANTSGSWTGTLSLAALDRLYIRCVPSGAPTAAAISLGCALSSTVAGTYHYGWVAGSSAGAAYSGPTKTFQATEPPAQHIGNTETVTFTGLALASTVAPGLDKSYGVTFRVNGATPVNSPTATLSGTALTAADTSGHTLSVTSADVFNVLGVPTVGATVGIVVVACAVVTTPPCTFTVAPTAVSVAYPASSGHTIDVTTNHGECAWTAVADDAWITVTGGASGTDSGTVTVAITENRSASPRVGTLTIAGYTVTVTQAAHPLYSPCPTVDLATTLCGISEFLWWVEWANWHAPDNISVFGCIDLADPPGYFGGWKPGKALACSSAARAMSGIDGAYEGGYFSVQLADHDRGIRHILRTSAPWGRSARGDAVVVRLISDEGRRALAEPAVIAHGIVEGAEFGDDLSVTFRVRDGMAMAGYDGLVPLRLVTLADFPNCPPDTVGKRVPIVYGTLSDASEDTPVGAYEPLYVGQRVAGNGGTYHAWLIAGHAIYGGAGFGCYVDGVLVGAGAWSWPGDPDYPDLHDTDQHWTDINDHRYTFVYGVGPEADEVAAGAKIVRLNLQGVEDASDGSGDLIDSYPLQVAHALQNWIIKPHGFETYETGLWHIPKWPSLAPDPDDGVCVVAVETFQALAGSPPDQTGGGFVIGANGEAEDAKQVISRLTMNGGFHIGLNARWQVVGYRVDLTTPTSSLPLIDELADDLTACEVDESALADLHATNARYTRTRRTGTLPSLTIGSPATPIPIQEWLATAVRRDAIGADEYGDIPTELALDAVADDTWAQVVCDYWLRLRRHPPRVVRVTGPLCLYSSYDVGDAVRVRHDLLVTEATTDVIRGVVHRVVIDPMRGTCRLDLWDLTDTFEDGA